MAASAIDKPGTKYGPCKDETCTHSDCEASRKVAACICRLCDKPIGYGKRCYDEWYEQPEGSPRYGFFIHEMCLWKEQHGLDPKSKV